MQNRAAQAEQQLAVALDRVAESATLQTSVDSLRQELSTARSLTGEHDIQRVLADYQRREVQGAEERAQLQAQLQSQKAAEATLRQDLAETTSELQVRSNSFTCQMSVLCACVDSAAIGRYIDLFSLDHCHTFVVNHSISWALGRSTAMSRVATSMSINLCADLQTHSSLAKQF